MFTAPLLTYAAHPKSILENPAVGMIKSIPAAWDETIVLPESEIGEVAALARRSGETWFLAIVNGPTGRALDVPLSFLEEGAYRVLTVADVKDDPVSVQIDEATATREGALSIRLSDGGGFVARFRRDSAAADAR